MKKNVYVIGWVLFVIFGFFFFTFLLKDDKNFSKEENRTLSQKPKFTLTSFIDNDYQKEYESYSSDQFPNRSFWMQIKTNTEKFLGVKKINGVYFGKDNMLISEAANPSKNFIKRRIENILKLKNKYNDKYLELLLIPNKIGIYKNDIDYNVDQEKLYNSFIDSLGNDIVKINTFDILNKHKNEKIFYDTDHHWTSLGAKYISDEFTKSNDKYDIYTSNDKFVGTLANKIAYYKNYDEINLYIPQNDIKLYVEYSDDKNIYTSLYKLDKQFFSSPYDIFLGGNHSTVSIKTSSKNERKLLILKDSYANCFVPFLTSHYSEITLVDPRYYFDDLDKLIKEKEVTDILLLYNMNTFFDDTSFDDLIENIK